MVANWSPVAEASKALTDTRLREQQAGSIVSIDPAATQTLGDRVSFLYLGTVADGFPAWGSAPTARDRKMREFIVSGAESMTTGAFATIIARNCGFSWALDGPPATVARVYDILHSANQGAGWLDWVAKTTLDILTCDKGTFTHLIRKEDNPTSPVIGIEYLDSIYCFSTGDPLTPVVYLDYVSNKWHKLKWYQVIHLTEMPAGIAELPGLQICAMTRILRAAQLYKNIVTYQEEKTGGRFTRAIHMISGIQQKQLDDALMLQNERADAQLLTRYMKPLVIAAVDPEHPPAIASFEMATLPDGFDPEQYFKLFMTVLSMGLLSDYQEFAPLPGGNLGTSTQSEILHLKSRGKGPGLFMKWVTHALNNHGVMPRSVTFRYDEQDIAAEKEKAAVAAVRATTRSTMILNGEIDSQGARQMAVDSGDLPKAIFQQMGQVDITGETRLDTTSDTTQHEDGDGPSIEGTTMQQDGRQGGKALSPARIALEEEGQEAILRVLGGLQREITTELRKTDPEPVKVHIEPQEVKIVVESVAPSPPLEPRKKKQIVKRDDKGRITEIETVE